jgi:HlyD family secretion protein
VNRKRPAIIVFILLAVAAAAWLLLGRSTRESTLSGYVEADSLFLATPVAGTIETIAAAEGQRVAAGAQLFTVEPATLSTESEQAQAQILSARSDIATAEANAEQAEAEAAAAAVEVDKARRDLNRLLSVRNADAAAVAAADVDAAQAALRESNARLRAARDLAQARRAQVSAAQAHEQQARGGARGVRIRIDQLSPPAPSAGRVEEIFYRPGEWVAANQPIVSLLPDDRVKIRFFVPEAHAANYRPGRLVRFSCDGCASDLSARISYVSPRPEFTPPIIFSRDSRDRLVFMVEAVPAHPARLMPGLPVDVEPLQ